MTTAFGLYTAALAILTLLPLSKIPHGLVRGPAFARLQWMCLALLGALASLFALTGSALIWIAAALILIALINATYIAKFTTLWPVQSRDPDDALRRDTSRHIKILASNVKMSNRAYDRLITLTRQHAPDVLIAIETDAAWTRALSALHNDYPHRIEVPHDTGYGITLLSRLTLRDHDIREIITKGVPSLRTVVDLPCGAPIALYAAHPEPPVASHDTIGRDSEIAAIGIEARDTPLPAIVTGDLNDVAWSTTTRRFQRISGLLDPRVGRGFFNTFHAHYPVFRWPLDHLFHDANFRLIHMARLPDIGSDHFPLVFTLALASDRQGTAPAAIDGEEAETQAMIRTEAARPRDPIGTDWEN